MLFHFCDCFLPCVCVCVCVSRSVMSDPLQSHGLQPTRLLCPWDSPGKNSGVSCYFLLQEIFPTQGSNLGLLHYRQILYHLNHQGSPVCHIQHTIFRYIMKKIIPCIVTVNRLVSNFPPFHSPFIHKCLLTTYNEGQINKQSKDYFPCGTPITAEEKEVIKI